MGPYIKYVLCNWPLLVTNFIVGVQHLLDSAAATYPLLPRQLISTVPVQMQ